MNRLLFPTNHEWKAVITSIQHQPEDDNMEQMKQTKLIEKILTNKEYCEKNGITDIHAHLKVYVDAYNKTAVPYKKIGILKVRDEEFPKNTLRKIMRFKLDMTID